MSNTVNHHKSWSGGRKYYYVSLPKQILMPSNVLKHFRLAVFTKTSLSRVVIYIEPHLKLARFCTTRFLIASSLYVLISQLPSARMKVFLAQAASTSPEAWSLNL